MQLAIRVIVLVGISLCAATMGCTQDKQGPEWCNAPVVFSSTARDGTRFELSIPRTALREAPGWQPGQGEPPISIAKAVNVATTWAAGHRGHFDELRMEELTLNNGSCAAGDGQWYYRVIFLPVHRPEGVDINVYVIAILMDGKVIETHKVSGGS